MAKETVILRGMKISIGNEEVFPKVGAWQVFTQLYRFRIRYAPSKKVKLCEHPSNFYAFCGPRLSIDPYLQLRVTSALRPAFQVLP